MSKTWTDDDVRRVAREAAEMGADAMRLAQVSTYTGDINYERIARELVPEPAPERCVEWVYDGRARKVVYEGAGWYGAVVGLVGRFTIGYLLNKYCHSSEQFDLSKRLLALSEPEAVEPVGYLVSNEQGGKQTYYPHAGSPLSDCLRAARELTAFWGKTHPGATELVPLYRHPPAAAPGEVVGYCVVKDGVVLMARTADDIVSFGVAVRTARRYAKEYGGTVHKMLRGDEVTP
jgi:hypothetical protein